ncbi:hypothetical protein HDV64DRAFT_252921 [Trichoderma sp. TUCIM 5745]
MSVPVLAAKGPGWIWSLEGLFFFFFFRSSSSEACIVIRRPAFLCANRLHMDNSPMPVYSISRFNSPKIDIKNLPSPSVRAWSISAGGRV